MLPRLAALYRRATTPTPLCTAGGGMVAWGGWMLRDWLGAILAGMVLILAAVIQAVADADDAD